MKQVLTRQQFDCLYERFLPRMYQAALCLLGDQQAAQEATETAWLSASAEIVVPDERTFGVQSARALVAACAKVQQRTPYQLGDALEACNSRMATLVRYLSVLSFEERCYVVLAAVQNFQPCEIARILRRPEWFVKRRLSDVLQVMCSFEGQLATAG